MIKNMPLKFKMMTVLVLLSIAILLTYAALALTDFRRDKIAYVFDSTLSYARSTAQQLRGDLEFNFDKVEFYSRGYASAERAFHPYSRSVFAGEKRLGLLASFHGDPTLGRFTRAATMTTPLVNDEDIARMDALSSELIKDALLAKVALRPLSVKDGKWLMGVRTEDAAGGDPFVILAIVVRAGFLEAVVNSRLQDTFVLGPDGGIILGSASPLYAETPAPDIATARATVAQSLAGAPETTQRLRPPQTQSDMLISGASVGLGDLKVMTLIPTSSALTALTALVRKSTLFILLLICVTVFLSLLGSTTLTAPLQQLYRATQKIADGDFNVQLEARGKDEIGSLAQGFNVMAREIARLLEETAEKARMKSELQTAQLVQSTLFPSRHFASGPIEIAGFYEPASECGGDWWFHNQIGDKTYLWIGDATGHGVPAALVTAAARSAANVVDEFPDLPPGKLMEILNRAIYGTSKGQVLMTFFLGVYDASTWEFTYCNASHDPPFLFPGRKTPLAKSDVQPLMDGRGPRLGENPEHAYEMVRMSLQPGDRIVFYTDGVTELKDSGGGMLGERKLLKSLLESFNKSAELPPAMADLEKSLADFRGTAALSDDVTYFMFRVKS